MSDVIKVFIENPGGTNIKNIHDEKTLEYKGSIQVARPYPFPYGFILGTTSEDGGNLDCYVLTHRVLSRSSVVDCLVLGLMEQFEDGKSDHNILATPTGEVMTLTESMKSELRVFVAEVFSKTEVCPSSEEMQDFLYKKAKRLKSKKINAGKFLGIVPARRLIKQCSDKT